MSTQAQDRFNAAGTLFLHAPRPVDADVRPLDAVAGMARAAFERAEEVNRQLFAEVELRVRKDDATAAAIAGFEQAIAQLQETVRVARESLEGIQQTVRQIARQLADVPDAIDRQGGH